LVVKTRFPLPLLSPLSSSSSVAVRCGFLDESLAGRVPLLSSLFLPSCGLVLPQPTEHRSPRLINLSLKFLSWNLSSWEETLSTYFIFLFRDKIIYRGYIRKQRWQLQSHSLDER
jgi:hypothetical protein